MGDMHGAEGVRGMGQGGIDDNLPGIDDMDEVCEAWDRAATAWQEQHVASLFEREEGESASMNDMEDKGHGKNKGNIGRERHRERAVIARAQQIARARSRSNRRRERMAALGRGKGAMPQQETMARACVHGKGKGMRAWPQNNGEGDDPVVCWDELDWTNFVRIDTSGVPEIWVRAGSDVRMWHHEHRWGRIIAGDDYIHKLRSIPYIIYNEKQKQKQQQKQNN